MKTRKLSLLICAIAIVLYSILVFVGLCVNAPDINAVFSLMISGFENVAGQGDVSTLLSVVSFITHFVQLVIFPLVGAFGILSVFIKKLRKAYKIVLFASLPLALFVIISSFFQNGIDYINWFYLPLNLALSGFLCCSLFNVMRLLKDSDIDVEIDQESKKKRKSLLLTTAICSSVFSLVLILICCGGLFVQNVGRADIERQAFGLETASEINGYIPANSIKEYVDGEIERIELRSYEEYFARKERYNDIIEKEYIIIPKEDSLVYVLDNGLMSTTVFFDNFELPYEGLIPYNSQLFKAKALECYKTGLISFVKNINNKTQDERINVAMAPLLNNKNKVVAVCCVHYHDISLLTGFDVNLFYVSESIFYLAAIVMTLSIHFIGLTIVEPISKLNIQTKKLVTTLQSDTPLEKMEKQNNEIGELTDTFEKVVEETRAYIKKSYVLEKEKNILATELDIASRIQLSLLPNNFISNENFDLYALTKPTKEVGGDFYDFFMIDDNHLAFVVGDVSGKGVPAALFMAVGKTIIKASVVNNEDLSKAVTIINKTLCESNKEGMFITSFIGVLNVKNGELRYVNAGHLKPLIRKKDGSFAMIPLKINLLFARFENATYESGFIKLDEDDVFVEYSDGATDANNTGGDMIKNQGLLNIFNSLQYSSMKSLLTNALTRIEEFENGADQFDDITMLAIAFKPSSSSVSVRASLDEYSKIEDYLDNAFKKLNVAKKAKRRINTIIDEMFRNIVSYAYQEHIGKVEISLRYQNDDLLLTFIDEGRPFNLLDKEEVDIKKHPSAFINGGLGIHVVKTLAKSIEYKRNENKNIVNIVIIND